MTGRRSLTIPRALVVACIGLPACSSPNPSPDVASDTGQEAVASDVTDSLDIAQDSLDVPVVDAADVVGNDAPDAALVDAADASGGDAADTADEAQDAVADVGMDAPVLDALDVTDASEASTDDLYEVMVLDASQCPTGCDQYTYPDGAFAFYPDGAPYCLC